MGVAIPGPPGAFTVAAAGWDHPRSAHYYERFCETHERYARANAALLAHSDLGLGMAVLDFGAGLGHTARGALDLLGGDGRIVCFEPHRAMRDAGQRRLRDPRATWVATLPETSGAFDRVL